MGWWQEQTDRVIKTCRDTFTTEFVYKPAAGGEHEMTGIFDEAFVSVEMLDGVPVQAVGPRIGVRLADIEALGITPDAGDTITVGSKTYRVDAFQPDGEAGAVLILDRVS